MDRHLKVEMNDFRLLASGDFYLRVGLKTPISVNLKSPMYHVSY